MTDFIEKFAADLHSVVMRKLAALPQDVGSLMDSIWETYHAGAMSDDQFQQFLQLAGQNKLEHSLSGAQGILDQNASESQNRFKSAIENARKKTTMPSSSATSPMKQVSESNVSGKLKGGLSRQAGGPLSKGLEQAAKPAGRPLFGFKPGEGGAKAVGQIASKAPGVGKKVVSFLGRALRGGR